MSYVTQNITELDKVRLSMDLLMLQSQIPNSVDQELLARAIQTLKNTLEPTITVLD